MTKFIYARVSTDEEQTTTNQVHAITRTHKDCFMQITDEGVSGKVHPFNRDGFNRLMKLTRKGDVIVVTALDRISRNVKDAIETIEALLLKGVSVVSLRESIDMTTASGRAMANVIFTFAQLERDNIAERTSQALQRRKAEGKPYTRPVTESGTEARRMLSEGCAVADVIAATGLSRSMVYKLKKVCA